MFLAFILLVSLFSITNLNTHKKYCQSVESFNETAITVLCGGFDSQNGSVNSLRLFVTSDFWTDFDYIFSTVNLLFQCKFSIKNVSQTTFLWSVTHSRVRFQLEQIGRIVWYLISVSNKSFTQKKQTRRKM